MIKKPTHLLLLTIALLVSSIASLQVNVEMHSSQLPMIRWNDDWPCTSGNVSIKALLGIDTPIQNFSFSGDIQRFRLPRKLLSKEIYTAQVICDDNRMGLAEKFSVNLNQEDWNPSMWIQGNSSNLFRKQINLTQAQTGSLYIAAAGYYKVFVNGRLINNDSHLDAGTTHFSIRSLSVVYYDIQLQQGENVVAVMLGKGWFGSGHGYNQNPKVRLIMFGNDSHPVVFTDDSWKTKAGPVTMDAIYEGETYDARLEIPGWDNIGFDDSNWNASIKVSPSDLNPTITMRTFPAIRTNSTLAPVTMTNPRPGIWVLDFGRTITGFTSLINVTGSAGENITLQHGEIMDHFHPNSSDLVFFGNLGIAQAIDTYYLSGKGLESHTPMFTYHGFRFVQVQNWPNGSVPRPENFLAIQMYTAVEQVGSFKTNNDILNRIHNMTVHSQVNNLMSYPTDCNNRDERLGWMADAWMTAEEAFYNFEMTDFYRNYLNVIHDDQFYDGRLSDIAPIFWISRKWRSNLGSRLSFHS